MKNRSVSFRRAFGRLYPAFTLAIITLISVVKAQEPSTAFTYQGTLTRLGIPSSGIYDFQFILETAPVNGTPVGTNLIKQVIVTNGLFEATLDYGTSPFSGLPVYLQVGLRTNGSTLAYSILSPAQPINPNPYAIHANTAMNTSTLAGYDWSSILVNGNNPAQGQIAGSKLAVGTIPGDRLVNGSITGVQIALGAISGSQIMAGTITSNQIKAGTITSDQILSGTIDISKLAHTVADFLVPVGTIIAFAGPSTKIPDGWFLCNGTIVSRRTYTNLFIAIDVAWGKGDGSTTFSIPDLEGFFLRGMDYGTGRDPDRLSRYYQPSGGGIYSGVGSYQAAQIQAHNHAFRRGITAAFGSEGIAIAPGSTIDGLSSAATDKIVTAGGSETRPINAYVNYIIKY